MRRAPTRSKSRSRRCIAWNSSGLLQTEGHLRNRVVTELFGAAANGVGRNFLIQQFLESGSYQRP